MEDSEDEEIEIIVKFIKSKKVTINESKNKTYLINDEDYLMKKPKPTPLLKKLLERKQ